MTTRAPASPKARLVEHAARAAALASPGVEATTTPLPAARPSALTTSGPGCAIDERLGRRELVEDAERRGGDAGLRHETLGEGLRRLRSRRRPGRDRRTGCRRRASRRRAPPTSGASGPQTTRSARSATAVATSSGTASAAIGMQRTCGSAAMPGLPGATTSSATSGLAAIFQASACSRPPDPTRRTRISAGSGARR